MAYGLSISYSAITNHGADGGRCSDETGCRLSGDNTIGSDHGIRKGDWISSLRDKGFALGVAGPVRGAHRGAELLEKGAR